MVQNACDYNSKLGMIRKLLYGIQKIKSTLNRTLSKSIFTSQILECCSPQPLSEPINGVIEWGMKKGMLKERPMAIVFCIDQILS
ncbi:hypothetical protein FRC0190_00595 [Corynebacterium rouxii]|uniref:Uncharacterized protein n=1 Tax=Corynebacterium rouxii TaxID=2719119 RepID=A0A6I8MFQ9_9CORY|nr:hypothetical protein FRC0190_00595 [Corynebacterium rouxii]